MFLKGYDVKLSKRVRISNSSLLVFLRKNYLFKSPCVSPLFFIILV